MQPDNTPQQTSSPAPAADTLTVEQQGAKSALLAAYILYIIGLFVGLVTVIGVIVLYVKRKDAAGTWMESHYSWLISTFWIALILSLVLILLAVATGGLGMILYLALAIWYVYRVIKGLIYFFDQKPLS